MSGSSANRVDRPVLIVVVGPTGVGKTATAIEIARAFGTVVVSADSRQFYRELSIGTAKPTLHEQAGIPHYFIDSHTVTANLSAGDFEREALPVLSDLFQRFPVVVLAGGSGLFVDAVCRGLDDLPRPEPGIREKWNRFYSEFGIDALAEALKQVDPAYYATVDLQNPQRLVRALEVYDSTGRPFSEYRQGKSSQRPFRTIWIGLERPRDLLYQRINERVDQMMEAGLLDEVRSLSTFRQVPALKTVGYAELFQYLDGDLSLDDAIAKIKQNTRRYAKRQLTWFKKNAETIWFQPDELHQMIDFLQQRIRELH